MKILLLGGNGQVGFELITQLAPLGDVTVATRSGVLPGRIPCRQVDLLVPSSAASLISEIRPDCIVNAAAYTAVDRAEDEPDVALRANGLALGEIGKAANDIGALVVHYSTDYVFPGASSQPYREEDAVGPVSAYGESKLAGEQELSSSGAARMIFRTAWVYGSRGHNFLRTMLRVGRERDELRVVDDQRGAPTSSALIAAVTVQAIGQWFRSDQVGRAQREGLFHLASGGETTWHGFAQAIFHRALSAGLIERMPIVHAIGSADFPAKATRPGYSVLDTRKLRTQFSLDLPSWTTALDHVIADLADRV